MDASLDELQILQMNNELIFRHSFGEDKFDVESDNSNLEEIKLPKILTVSVKKSDCKKVEVECKIQDFLMIFDSAAIHQVMQNIFQLQKRVKFYIQEFNELFPSQYQLPVLIESEAADFSFYLLITNSML